MTQYIDKSALVAEIERKIAFAQAMSDNAINSSMQQFFDGMKDCGKQLSTFLSTLEAKDVESENVSTDLDEAAEGYANKEYPDEPSCGQWGTGDYEPPIDMEYPREIATDAFKAGAQWMASQGESYKETVQSSVIGPPLVCCPAFPYEDGDEVIVQIRKYNYDPTTAH